LAICKVISNELVNNLTYLFVQFETVVLLLALEKFENLLAPLQLIFIKHQVLYNLVKNRKIQSASMLQLQYLYFKDIVLLILLLLINPKAITECLLEC
jgi:hypothetical protein